MQNDSRTSSFSRRQTAGKLGLAASAALVVMLAASEVREILLAMNEDGFAQSLRQSAWAKALSGQATTESWPWQNLSPHMSHLSSAKVRRLGLSASLREISDAVTEADSALADPQSLADQAVDQNSMEGDIALGDVNSGTVSIGDSITFTASDGATCVYHVTGRPVVDPHLDLGQAGGAMGESGLFDCSPLDTLIMRSSHQIDKTTPQGRPAEHQRKL
jgi:hypothetical protein